MDTGLFTKYLFYFFGLGTSKSAAALWFESPDTWKYFQVILVLEALSPVPAGFVFWRTNPSPLCAGLGPGMLRVHPKPELSLSSPFPACTQSSFPCSCLLPVLPWRTSPCCWHTSIPVSRVFYRTECLPSSQTGAVALAISADNQHQGTFYWVSLIFIPCRAANVHFRLTCGMAFLRCTAGARCVCSGSCTRWCTPTSGMEMNKCGCGPCN